eukprot:930651-Prymnesium_polylepis.1
MHLSTPSAMTGGRLDLPSHWMRSEINLHTPREGCSSRTTPGSCIAVGQLCPNSLVWRRALQKGAGAPDQLSELAGPLVVRRSLVRPLPAPSLEMRRQRAAQGAATRALSIVRELEWPLSASEKLE